MAGPLKVAAQRKPMRRAYRPRAVLARPASAAAMSALQAAIAAINGAGESLEGDAALAQMEQHRIDAEAQRRRQGCLSLRGATE